MDKSLDKFCRPRETTTIFAGTFPAKEVESDSLGGEELERNTADDYFKCLCT